MVTNFIKNYNNFVTIKKFKIITVTNFIYIQNKQENKYPVCGLYYRQRKRTALSTTSGGYNYIFQLLVARLHFFRDLVQLHSQNFELWLNNSFDLFICFFHSHAADQPVLSQDSEVGFADPVIGRRCTADGQAGFASDARCRVL